MYKVLIADDEKNIRDGLKAILDWSDLGYEIVGEASNGEEAVNSILNLNPDVVLMDIHMPKFYGIEAIKNVKERGFQGEFIILSGYSDFTYAQSAMRYGVEFYLTKPIDEDELLSVVTRIKKELDNKANDERNVRLYKNKAKNVFLHEIITGTVSMNELSLMKEEDLSDLGLLYDDYQVAIYEKFGLEPEEPSYDVSEMFNNLDGNVSNFDFFEEEGNNLILIKGHNAIKKFERFVEKYRQDEIMHGSPLDTVFIVYGRPVNSVDEIYLSFEEALTLSKRRYFCEQGQHVLGYEALADCNKENAEKFENELVATYATRITDCMQTFNRGSLAEVMHSIEQTVYSADLDRNNAVLFMLDLYMQIQEKTIRIWPDVELPFNNKDVIIKIRGANYFYEIIMLITDQIKTVMEKMDSSNRDTIVNDILYYIDHNYQSNITLEAIAPLFGYSSAYIGKLIYKSVGEYFNTYVDRKRIEKSKILLAQENIKVYEIASRVGYGNVDYFHKKFKKFEGVSPAQYRKNLRSI